MSALLPRSGLYGVGSTGADVLAIQNRLERAGFDVGTPDGDFGTNTRAAVEAFQRSRPELRADGVDGVVGRDTLRALRNARAARNADVFEQPRVQPRRTVAQNNNNAAPVRSADLRRLDNTRVDTQMPDSGPGYIGSFAASKRFGTARTVETIKQVAANYNRATGQTLRIGDISRRGGGSIDGHHAHQHGNNVDVDMAFNDGRTRVEPNRESRNASWRSPAYDRDATRRLAQEIRRVNPNADILFNDPVLAREGLVRPFPNHDNHLHIQGLN